ncbi:aminotransferase class IV [Tistrella bauzanensis]|uniref:Probable branched-chain-amino-acid aminotransferase n=1 Tax=Tistrella arctica TaxID=3133430 RepID=A0ABU9YH96_9PROT
MPMPERSPKTYPLCFHDGAVVPWEQATLHAASIALRYAVSVFEGIRIYQTDDGLKVLALAPHLDRLARSAQMMWLPDPGIDGLGQIIADLVARNGAGGDCYVRPSISAGNPGELGQAAQSLLTVTLTAQGRKTWLAEDRRMKLKLSSWQRAHDLAFPSSAKNISNYAGARIAMLEAKASGFDNVVLANADGYLSEAPTAILFLVRDGQLLTPALSEGVLPSITRALTLEIAAELGIPASEGRLTRADAWTADEAFLCGTGLEYACVGQIDGHVLRHGAASPVSQRIIARYFERARDPRAAAGDLILPSAPRAAVA